MERKNLDTAIEFAAKSFLPGAFLFAASVIIVFPLIFSRGNFGVLKGINWAVFCLEQLVLTSGFSIMLSFLLKRGFALKINRGIAAGVLSIILLGAASVFTQGANLLMIIMLSLLAGMISTLTMLPFNRRPIL